MSERVSNQIFNNVNRKLPNIFDVDGAYVGRATGVTGIGVDTPADYGGRDATGDKNIAMGAAGHDNSVSLCMSEANTVKLWLWEGAITSATYPQGRWVLGGAVAAEYQKAADAAYAKFGFWMAEGQLFFLSATTPCEAWVGARTHEANPDV